MLALALQESGEETYLLFEEDFYYTNGEKREFDVFTFSGQWEDTSFYLKSFHCKERVRRPIGAQDILHMRLEPPFDGRLSALLVDVEGTPRERRG